MRQQLIALGLIAAVVGALAGGFWLGGEWALKKAYTAQHATDEREARIRAVIVERNPQATIKDFDGFERVLIEESLRAGVDYRLIMAVIDKESQFNPKAVGGVGEIGLMQLRPETARLVVGSSAVMARIGNTYQEPSKRRSDGSYVELGTLGDPKANVIIGIAFLKERMDKYGKPETALRAYNRGDAKATEHRPDDRYAESIAFKYVALVPRLPE